MISSSSHGDMAPTTLSAFGGGSTTSALRRTLPIYTHSSAGGSTHYMKIERVNLRSTCATHSG